MASLISNLQSKLGYSHQKALLLGAGFVTKPTVQILADAGVEVTVGQSFLSCIQELCANICSLPDTRERKEIV